MVGSLPVCLLLPEFAFCFSLKGLSLPSCAAAHLPFAGWTIRASPDRDNKSTGRRLHLCDGHSLLGYAVQKPCRLFSFLCSLDKFSHAYAPLWLATEACRPERMMIAVTTNPNETPIPADADGSHYGVSAVMAEYKLAEHEKNRAWKILACGSVAGTLSGLMGTLAGQPGPPLILMFALLKVPKVLVCPVSQHCSCRQHMSASCCASCSSRSCSVAVVCRQQCKVYEQQIWYHCIVHRKSYIVNH